MKQQNHLLARRLREVAAHSGPAYCSWPSLEKYSIDNQARGDRRKPRRRYVLRRVSKPARALLAALIARAPTVGRGMQRHVDERLSGAGRVSAGGVLGA